MRWCERVGDRPGDRDCLGEAQHRYGERCRRKLAHRGGREVGAGQGRQAARKGTDEPHPVFLAVQDRGEHAADDHGEQHARQARKIAPNRTAAISVVTATATTYGLVRGSALSRSSQT